MAWSTVIAATIGVARRGQQRSLVSSFQVFNVAMARSPGARLRAWLRLTTFWLRDNGFGCRRYGTAMVGPAAW